MSSKKEGGDFLGGVPRVCFSSGNPCGGDVAGDRAVLEKTTTAVAKPLAVCSAEDDSHLSDFNRINKADVSSDQFLNGGVLVTN